MQEIQAWTRSGTLLKLELGRLQSSLLQAKLYLEVVPPTAPPFPSIPRVYTF